MFNKSFAIATLVFALFTSVVRADEIADAKKTADLNWAKGVAADFLAAAVSGQDEQAATLVDPSLKAAFGKDSDAQFRDWLNNTFAIYGYGESAFESEEIAPDRDEVVLKGYFKDTKPARTFSIRVVKNKDSGMWRVNYCRVSGR